MKFLNLTSTNTAQRQNNIKIPDEVTTFGQLAQYLESLDINIGGYKATWVAPGDPLHNSSPETAEASIPQVETAWLSLSPHSTNKGATYNEMKTFVKEARRKAEVNNDTVTFQLIGDYTRLQTSEMEVLYNKLQSVSTTSTISESRIKDLESQVSSLLSSVARLVTKVNELEDTINDLELDNDTTDDEEEDVYSDDEDLEEDENDDVPEEVKALWRSQGLI